MPKIRYNLIVGQDKEGLRLDQFLVTALFGKSRSYLQKLIRQGSILVNNKKAKPSVHIAAYDGIDITIPEPLPLNVNPEPIPLDVIYEDNHLIVINKQPGIKVHPSLNNLTHTLVNAFLYHCKGGLSGIGGVLRPGIVHRLDMDTSGCMVAAKDDETHNGLAGQFHNRTIFKEYFAILSGRMQQPKARLEFAIGRNPVHRKRMAVRFDKGKEAITEYKVLKQFENAAYVSIRMGTGRTHQIRVHMAYIGHPVLGDKQYGSHKAKLRSMDIDIPRQMLHAHRLGFTHPVTGKWMEFTAPLPEDMSNVLNKLGELAKK